ncbi:hypothetical protein VCRA213O314_410030 [Vibrio crassostreae]|nr:hypothetical protein VCRA213O314_410030 [Vibrio crassostreae]
MKLKDNFSQSRITSLRKSLIDNKHVSMKGKRQRIHHCC